MEIHAKREKSLTRQIVTPLNDPIRKWVKRERKMWIGARAEARRTEKEKGGGKKKKEIEEYRENEKERKKERKGGGGEKKDIVDEGRALMRTRAIFHRFFQPDEGRDLTTENEEMSSPPSLSPPRVSTTTVSPLIRGI